MLWLLSSYQTTPIVTTLNFDTYITKVSPLAASPKPVTQWLSYTQGAGIHPPLGAWQNWAGDEQGPIASKFRNLNLTQSTFAREVPFTTPVVTVPAKLSFLLYPRIRGWQINARTLHRNQALSGKLLWTYFLRDHNISKFATKPNENCWELLETIYFCNPVGACPGDEGWH